jgi:hypothetical protein
LLAISQGAISHQLIGYQLTPNRVAESALQVVPLFEADG